MRGLFISAALLVLLAPVAAPALAHGVSAGDGQYLESVEGVAFWPLFYLGAKHMVTGYDHLLFLVGVIFFLRGLHEVAIYVTLFSLGHSITLLTGVLAHLQINAYLVDAVIGLSIVYKALDNLGAFRTLLGRQPNVKLAVFGFGLVHGFGLSTKLQDFQLSENGLFGNIVSFNIGVECGQMLALVVLFGLISLWRTTSSFSRLARLTNIALMSAGFVFFQYQLFGFFLETA